MSDFLKELNRVPEHEDNANKFVRDVEVFKSKFGVNLSAVNLTLHAVENTDRLIAYSVSDKAEADSATKNIVEVEVTGIPLPGQEIYEDVCLEVDQIAEKYGGTRVENSEVQERNMQEINSLRVEKAAPTLFDIITYEFRSPKP